jgi:hypothetical protein
MPKPCQKSKLPAASKLLYVEDFELELPMPTDMSGLEDTSLVDDDILIDPRLLNTGSDIVGTLFGLKSIEMTEEMENNVFVQLEEPQTAIAGLDFMLAEPIEFVRRFSRINIT